MTRALSTTDYLRTRFLGFSVTHGFWSDFRARINNPSNWELLWYSGGSVDVWADSNSAAWLGDSGDPANTSGLIDGVGGDSTGDALVHTAQVDRIILNVSGLSAALHLPGGYSSDVSEWRGYISTTIANIRSKYPNVKMILLQPNVGGPSGGTQCSAGGDSNAVPTNIIRCCYTSPYIYSACASLVRGNVRMGCINYASACAGFSDWAGHMVSGQYTTTGQETADYYNAHL